MDPLTIRKDILGANSLLRECQDDIYMHVLALLWFQVPRYSPWGCGSRGRGGSTTPAEDLGSLNTYVQISG
jgi:hypothetical protein